MQTNLSNVIISIEDYFWKYMLCCNTASVYELDSPGSIPSRGKVFVCPSQRQDRL
jgi:hypothetical protein